MNVGVNRQNTGDTLRRPREFSHRSGDASQFARGWRATIGDSIPLPTFVSPDLRGDSWAGRAGDAAINEIEVTAPVRTLSVPSPAEDVVRLWAVHRGRWSMPDPYGRGAHTIGAGQFLLQHVTQTSHFETAAGTASIILMFPHQSLKDVLRRRVLFGAVEDAPEVRLLLAHAGMVRQTLSGLGEAGLRAAESTLVELAAAVVRGRFDDQEAALAPALVRAAQELADARLTDGDLSSDRLAHELHVSVRTLQRAFAEVGEPVSAYVRRRRLEQARQLLSAGGSSVSEAAARFRFADSSHFIRAFRRQYGSTPTEDRPNHRPDRI